MRFAVAAALILVAGCVSPAPSNVDLPLPLHRDAILLATEAGNITILLYPEAAPATVALMRQYVGQGYYVGRAFYRTVPGHVIQVTDAAGGATDDNRTVPLETDARFHFSAGAAGTARGADPGSGGPEFFLMDFATSHLDGNYTLWGQVVAGLDVVHAIARGPAADFASLPSLLRPLEPTDRMSLAPTHILAATLVNVTLAPAEAAALPYQVARNARVADYRHSLQAPADLFTRNATLTWFIRPYNNAPVPSAERVSIHVGGNDLRVADGGVPGAYAFEWHPLLSGPANLRLDVDGVPWATLQLENHAMPTPWDHPPSPNSAPTLESP